MSLCRHKAPAYPLYVLQPLMIHIAPMCDCVHYARFSAVALSPPPHRTSLTTPACEARESISFLSNSISTCPGFAHTRMGVKVAEEGHAALGFAVGAVSFSPSVSHLSTPRSVSLFPPFYFSSLSLLLLSLAPGQRKALTPWLLLGLHCQLFFFFPFFIGEGGLALKTRGRAREREAERKTTALPLSLFSYIHLLPRPLSSH